MAGRLYRFCVLLMGTLILGGCGEEGLRPSGNAPDPQLQAPARQTVENVVVSGHLVDALSGEVLNNDPSVPRSVSVTGPGADRVVNGKGESLYDEAARRASVPVSFGMFTFYLPEAGDYPLGLQVSADVPGYLPTSVPLDILEAPAAGRPRLHPLLLPLVGLAQDKRDAQRDPVGGLGTDILEILLDGEAEGATRSTRTITVDSQGQAAQGRLEVRFPIDVSCWDKDEVLLEEPATARLHYGHPYSPLGLESFPGGLRSWERRDGSSLASPVPLVTAGLGSLEIVEEGIRAVACALPFAVDFIIPQGFVNPETGSEAAAGDSVPVWRLSEQGEWKPFAAESIRQEASGELRVGIETNRPGIFALAWDLPEDGCRGALNLSHTRSLETLGGLKLRFARPEGGWALSVPYAGGPERRVRIPAAPGKEPVAVTPMYGDKPFWGEFSVDLCASAPPQIDLQEIAAADVPLFETLSFPLHVVDVCSQNFSVSTPVPSVPFWMEAPAVRHPFRTYGVTDADGNTVLYGLVKNETYRLSAVDRRTGEVRWQNFTVDGTGRIWGFRQECKPVEPGPSDPTGATGGTGSGGDLN